MSPRSFGLAVLLVVLAMFVMARPAAAADSIVVTADQADVKDGEKVLARATRGQRFAVQEVRGDWYRIEFEASGRRQSGWVHRGQARLLPAGEQYALLVAVGDYDEKELRPLKFTRADILDFHQALLDSGVPPKNVVLMHDDLEKLVAHYKKLGAEFKPKDYLPLGAAIRSELELLLGRLTSDDSVIVAFSGHGVQFKDDKRSYFCPTDARLDDKKTLIPFEEVFAKLKGSPAGRKLLLVDACQNDPQSEISRSRSTVNLDSVTRPQIEPVPQGIIALFSCKAGQKAFEHPPLGHGVFFYHLLEGWKGDADLDGDGRLTYQELATYTERKTAEYASVHLKALQTPQLRTDFSGEWVLRELDQAPHPSLFDATRARTSLEARTEQKAWAKYLKTSVEMENSIGIKLRLIPPGEYRRGAAAEDRADALRDKNYTQEYMDFQQPQHLVRLSKPFLLGRTEITRGQFRRFVSATRYVTECEKTRTGGRGWNESTQTFDGPKPEYTWFNSGFPQTDDHPVVNITWNDADAFCRWLSKEEGKPYRLPTEAEWEYACRAGTQTPYSTGTDRESLRSVANVADATAIAKWQGYSNHDLTTYLKQQDGYAFTSPVASFLPNAFGLFDMHGNAWELMSDWFDPDEYSRYARQKAVDPTGPRTGTLRIWRGGSWDVPPIFSRSSHRHTMPADLAYLTLGFRVAADVGGK